MVMVCIHSSALKLHQLSTAVEGQTVLMEVNYTMSPTPSCPRGKRSWTSASEGLDPSTAHPVSPRAANLTPPLFTSVLNYL